MKSIFTFAAAILATASFAQSGNKVFSGTEAVIFSNLDLATPVGNAWMTDRGATPGYFGASGAAVFTNPSNAHNINGYVKHYATAADQAFNFPVGTGTSYRSLAISGTIPASSVIATAWIAGDPSTTTDPTGPSAGLHPTTTVGAGVSSVSAAGMWDWQDISNSAAGATVQVSIPDLTAFGPASSLRLVGWDGTSWVNLSAATGTTSATGNVENSVLAGVMKTGITAVGIGKSGVDLTPSIQLPVNSFAGSGSTRDLTFTIQEINGGSTAAGDAKVQFTVPLGYSLAFDPALATITPAGGSATMVQNTDWTILSTALSGRKITFQAKAGVSIGALQNSKIGLTVSRTDANVGATTTLVGSIVEDPAETYDSQIDNNNTGRTLTAN